MRNKRTDKSLMVGLDIGTSKVVAIVGEYQPGAGVEVIGIGSSISRGIRRGVVVDMESTTQSIQRAIEEAELMAGCEIQSVTAGIAGSHIQSFNSHGVQAIRDREVVEADVDRVIEAAAAVNLPADQHLLHVRPQEYIIDGQDGIHHPVGMAGVRLEMNAHLVTCARSAYQNVRKCVARCGLQIDEMVLQPLAASLAVLTRDERELGICLVDIGAGTTEIAIFCGGTIRHTAVLPIAGDQVTNDIAVALRTPSQYAEETKIRYACALTQLATAEESIQVPGVGDRPARRLARQTLAEVVEPRYEELFSLVQAEIRRSGLEEMIAAGVVLTGGAAKMEGVVELAEEVFHLPVRLGIPQYVEGLLDVVSNPVHSTGVGLLLWGSQSDRERIPGRTGLGGMDSAWDKFKSWFRGEF